MATPQSLVPTSPPGVSTDYTVCTPPCDYVTRGHDLRAASQRRERQSITALLAPWALYLLQSFPTSVRSLPPSRGALLVASLPHWCLFRAGAILLSSQDIMMVNWSWTTVFSFVLLCSICLSCMLDTYIVVLCMCLWGCDLCVCAGCWSLGHLCYL